jgi:colanic acid biosynthesis glycosyl transferase WcaI
MARILLHALVFPPDAVSTARLLGELTDGWQARGHSVCVLTTLPHYNPDPDLVREQPLRRVVPGVLYRSRLGQCDVWHVAMGRKRLTTIVRFFWFGVFHLFSAVVGLVLARRSDVVIVSSPPLTLGLVGGVIAAAARIPMIYHLHELYPDFLINRGYLRRPSAIRAARWLERRIYALSARVAVITPGFGARLQALGVPASKLVVIPNFPLDRAAQPLPPRRADGTFTVYYGGNLGLSQDWALLLAAAERVRDLPIRFILSGDGVRRDWLSREVARRGLDAVSVLGSRPLASLERLYAEADLVALPMLRRTCLDTFPSKVYSILASGRPILAAVDLDSDVARFLKASGAAIVVEPESLDAFVAALRAAFQDRDMITRMAGIATSAAAPFNRERCLAEFDAVIRDVTAPQADGSARPSGPMPAPEATTPMVNPRPLS